MLDFIKNAVNTAKNYLGMGANIAQAVQSGKGIFQATRNTVIANQVGKAAGRISPTLRRTAEKITTDVLNGKMPSQQNIKAALDEAKPAILSGLYNQVTSNTAIKFVTGLLDTVTNFVAKAISSVLGFFKSIFNYFSPEATDAPAAAPVAAPAPKAVKVENTIKAHKPAPKRVRVAKPLARKASSPAPTADEAPESEFESLLNTASAVVGRFTGTSLDASTLNNLSEVANTGMGLFNLYNNYFGTTPTTPEVDNKASPEVDNKASARVRFAV